MLFEGVNGTTFCYSEMLPFFVFCADCAIVLAAHMIWTSFAGSMIRSMPPSTRRDTRQRKKSMRTFRLLHRLPGRKANGI